MEEEVHEQNTLYTRLCILRSVTKRDIMFGAKRFLALIVVMGLMGMGAHPWIIDIVHRFEH